MNKKPFYITTTLPYVNDKPHIGHAMEMIRADSIVRFNRYIGRDVFFNTGTDEHGQKIYEEAIKANKDTKTYTDEFAEVFKDFHKMCNISYNKFIRTTDEDHKKAAQKFWNICLEKGDIYKSKQRINYCVGCEMEKTDSDLVNDKCPDHPNRDLVVTEEENYFFKASKYQKDLLDLYERGLVSPDFRNTEIKKFIEAGWKDFSVSRLKAKMPWGIGVPGDDEHVMYVWFDALINYISTLGWGSEDDSNFEKFWNNGEVVQYCGKDNNKAQSAIWQSMLFSAEVKNTDKININGHIISGGVKMSKSIGNVISPFDIVEEYKTVTDFPEDVLRFVMCHEVSTYDDSDITKESIKDAYKAYLQNGIGNQVSRILKLTSQYVSSDYVKDLLENNNNFILSEEFSNYMNNFKLNEAIHFITDKSKGLDEYIQISAPFKLVKDEKTLEEGVKTLQKSLSDLVTIVNYLRFFMPRTAEFIFDSIKENKPLEKGIFGRLD